MRTPSRAVAALAALLLLASAPRSLAQTAYTWNYAGSDWSTAPNWSPSGVPTAIDTAILGAFDGTTYTLPSFSANSAAGQFVILGPRTLANGTILGGGKTLTVGTGGTMSVAPFVERGEFGSTLTFDNLTVNIADGTTFATGYPQTVGAMELSGFTSRIMLSNGSQLRLVNASGTSNYDLTLNSGAQLFLNAGTQVTNGVGVNTATQGAVRFHGGGQFNFQGANATAGGSVTTTFNANQLVAASGHASVGVFAGSNSGANTANIVLNFGNSTLQRGIDRSTRDASGNIISLGSGTLEFAFNGIIAGFSGSRGQVFLRPGPTGVPTQNGVITEETSSNTNSPYVILVGQHPTISGTFGRFGTVNAGTGEVTAQLGTARDQNTLSSAAANENVIYRPTNSTANPTLSGNIAPQTIVFEPQASGQSVNLGGFTLTTPGILVDRPVLGTGTYTFSLDNGTIAGPASALRNIFVLGGSNTFFNVGATFAGPATGSGGGIVKSGLGWMVLTGTSPQMNLGGDIYINQGAIRAHIDGSGVNFGTNNVLNLRGGIFEVDAGGGTSLFTRNLGRDLGQVNWTSVISTTIADRGGGGFSAVNGALNVNIGSGQTLVWNGSTGGNQYFLRSGQSLRLGSFASTGIVTLQNPLALDDGSAGLPPESREIIVEALTFSPFPVYSQRSRITGVISGSAASGLTKVGPGMLELTAANTYAGTTSVGLGTLLVSNTMGSATGTGRVMVYDTLMGNGIIAPSAGNGLTVMAGARLFLYRDQAGGTPGNLTVGSAGTNNPVTLRSGATTLFQLNGTSFDPNGGASSYGRLTVLGTGAITIDGAALNVGLAAGYTPLNSDVFGILDNQTGNAISGTFTGIANNGTVSAKLFDGTVVGTFQVSYLGDISGSGISTSGGNDVVLYNFVPVPEPAAVVALAASAAGLVGLLRRGRGTPAVS